VFIISFSPGYAVNVHSRSKHKIRFVKDELLKFLIFNNF